MADNQKQEIEYVIQDVLPVFASQLGYPLPEDEKNTRIQSIPVRIGSGTKKPDVVYYHDGVPVFLIEAKRGGNLEDAINQALSYIRDFPVDEYSRDGIKPRFFAVTVGKNYFFYAHRFEIEKNNFKDWAEKLDVPISFTELLEEYGLKRIEKKEIFTPDVFRKEILNELGPIYKFEDKITPDVVKNVALQLLSFLRYGKDFTGHKPYIDLETHKDRQTQIRKVYEKFDWANSLSPETAKEFRSYILRSFQGTNLNQYLTEQCVIAFMLNLADSLSPDTKVLDFECGSGGFLAAVIDSGVELENIRGVDIDELPYIIAKTYLAIYFAKTGFEAVDTLPIKKDNGLFYQGNSWDLVIGNPAGGNKYEHGELDKIGENLNRDLDNNGRLNDNLSEYNLSIQQAVTSAKIGGKICLVLPEGFFSNSHDELLRKYVSKYCKVKAIISLPRGVFKKGTNVKQQQRGSQVSNQKMSIILLEKVIEVEKENPIGELDFTELNYPVFLASINEPESKSGLIEDWLEPELNVVLEQWQEWQQNNKLKEIPTVNIKVTSEEKPKIETLALFEEKGEGVVKKPAEAKSKTTINKFLEDLFK